MLKREILKYFTSKEKRLILIRNKREYAKVAKILNSAGLKWHSGHSYIERGYGLPCFLCNDGTFWYGNWEHLPIYSLKDLGRRLKSKALSLLFSTGFIILSFSFMFFIIIYFKLFLIIY